MAPPPRRRSCLKTRNDDETSEMTRNVGIYNPETTDYMNSARKRVSFSTANQIKEFKKNVSSDISEAGESDMDMTGLNISMISHGMEALETDTDEEDAMDMTKVQEKTSNANVCPVESVGAITSQTFLVDKSNPCIDRVAICHVKSESEADAEDELENVQPVCAEKSNSTFVVGRSPKENTTEVLKKPRKTYVLKTVGKEETSKEACPDGSPKVNSPLVISKADRKLVLDKTYSKIEEKLSAPDDDNPDNVGEISIWDSNKTCAMIGPIQRNPMPQCSDRPSLPHLDSTQSILEDRQSASPSALVNNHKQQSSPVVDMSMTMVQKTPFSRMNQTLTRKCNMSMTRIQDTPGQFGTAPDARGANRTTHELRDMSLDHWEETSMWKKSETPSMSLAEMSMTVLQKERHQNSDFDYNSRYGQANNAGNMSMTCISSPAAAASANETHVDNQVKRLRGKESECGGVTAATTEDTNVGLGKDNANNMDMSLYIGHRALSTSARVVEEDDYGGMEFTRLDNNYSLCFNEINQSTNMDFTKVNASTFPSFASKETPAATLKYDLRSHSTSRHSQFSVTKSVSIEDGKSPAAKKYKCGGGDTPNLKNVSLAAQPGTPGHSLGTKDSDFSCSSTTNRKKLTLSNLGDSADQNKVIVNSIASWVNTLPEKQPRIPIPPLRGHFDVPPASEYMDPTLLPLLMSKSSLRAIDCSKNAPSVPSISAFGKFGCAKTPKRVLPVDIVLPRPAKPQTSLEESSHDRPMQQKGVVLHPEKALHGKTSATKLPSSEADSVERLSQELETELKLKKPPVHVEKQRLQVMNSNSEVAPAEVERMRIEPVQLETEKSSSEIVQPQQKTPNFRKGVTQATPSGSVPLVNRTLHREPAARKDYSSLESNSKILVISDANADRTVIKQEPKPIACVSESKEVISDEHSAGEVKPVLLSQKEVLSSRNEEVGTIDDAYRACASNRQLNKQSAAVEINATKPLIEVTPESTTSTPINLACSTPEHAYQAAACEKIPQALGESIQMEAEVQLDHMHNNIVSTSQMEASPFDQQISGSEMELTLQNSIAEAEIPFTQSATVDTIQPPHPDVATVCVDAASTNNPSAVNVSPPERDMNSRNAENHAAVPSNATRFSPPSTDRLQSAKKLVMPCHVNSSVKEPCIEDTLRPDFANDTYEMTFEAKNSPSPPPRVEGITVNATSNQPKSSLACNSFFFDASMVSPTHELPSSVALGNLPSQGIVRVDVSKFTPAVQNLINCVRTQKGLKLLRAVRQLYWHEDLTPEEWFEVREMLTCYLPPQYFSEDWRATTREEADFLKTIFNYESKE